MWDSIKQFDSDFEQEVLDDINARRSNLIVGGRANSSHTMQYRIGAFYYRILDRTRPVRFKIAAIIVWSCFVSGIVFDYAFGRWDFRFWRQDHWLYLRTVWLDDRIGHYGFSNEFAAMVVLAALSLLIGSAILMFADCETLLDSPYSRVRVMSRRVLRQLWPFKTPVAAVAAVPPDPLHYVQLVSDYASDMAEKAKGGGK